MREMVPVPQIVLEDLEVGYGDHVVLRGVNATIYKGEIFVIMGGSGCGKSTLLRHMIGLYRPRKGRILFQGVPVEEWLSSPERVARSIGVLFQSGALWSSMTVFENVALPLEQYTELGAEERAEIVRLKLALVGLDGVEDFLPSQLSGGMQKRVALARALALDPEVLFLDEPSAGLDPVTSRKLDQLILQLRENLGTTFVVVTHELESIFTIADRAMFLDARTKTVRAIGTPYELFQESQDPVIREFLSRGRWVEQSADRICQSGPRSGRVVEETKNLNGRP